MLSDSQYLSLRERIEEGEFFESGPGIIPEEVRWEFYEKYFGEFDPEEYSMEIWNSLNFRPSSEKVRFLTAFFSENESALSKIIIEKGLDPDFDAGPDPEDGLGFFGEESLLHQAIRLRLNGTAKTLLKLGANPNIQDDEGFTALTQALEWNLSTELIALLMAHGSDPSIKNYFDRESSMQVLSKKMVEAESEGDTDRQKLLSEIHQILGQAEMNRKKLLDRKKSIVNSMKEGSFNLNQATKTRTPEELLQCAIEFGSFDLAGQIIKECDIATPNQRDAGSIIGRWVLLLLRNENFSIPGVKIYFDGVSSAFEELHSYAFRLLDHAEFAWPFVNTAQVPVAVDVDHTEETFDLNFDEDSEIALTIIRFLAGGPPTEMPYNLPAFLCPTEEE